MAHLSFFIGFLRTQAAELLPCLTNRLHIGKKKKQKIKYYENAVELTIGYTVSLFFAIYVTFTIKNYIKEHQISIKNESSIMRKMRSSIALTKLEI